MKGILALLLAAFTLTNSVAITAASKATIICAAEESDSILVEHEECTKFYICSKGAPIASACPRHPTLYYNDALKACDWPDNVDCGDRVVKEEFEIEEPKQIETPKEEAVNDDPSKAPEICAADGSDGVLVAHEDCDKFYKCSEKTPVAMSCGTNPILYYNPESKACDWPENVDCGSRVVVEAEADEKLEEVGEEEEDKNDAYTEDNRPYEEKAVEACIRESSDGELLPHGDCDKFYMCSEGRPVPFQCPVNPPLLYNTLLMYCDWADNVSCGDREIPQNVLK